MANSNQRRNNDKRPLSPQEKEAAEVARKAYYGEVRKLLEISKEQIEAALGGRYKLDFFIRSILTHVQLSEDPYLTKCDPKSIIAAGMRCAQVGLIPDSAMGDCWILSGFSAKHGCYMADMRIGYRGTNKLIYRSGEVLSIQAEVVHANDSFDVSLGTERWIKHVPYYVIGKTDPGEIVASYSTATLKNGVTEFRVIPRALLDRRRAMSGNPKDPNAWSNVWQKWPEAMCMKSASRDLSKWLPMEDDARRAIERDERAELEVIDVSARDPGSGALMDVATRAVETSTGPDDPLNALVRQHEGEGEGGDESIEDADAYGEDEAQ